MSTKNHGLARHNRLLNEHYDRLAQRNKKKRPQKRAPDFETWFREFLRNLNGTETLRQLLQQAYVAGAVSGIEGSQAAIRADFMAEVATPLGREYLRLGGKFLFGAEIDEDLLAQARQNLKGKPGK
jgi:hypothetical protein